MSETHSILSLIVQLADRRFALPVRSLVEVAPMVQMHPLPKAPDYLAGMFNYRGEVIPAIDLSLWVTVRPVTDSFSVRLLILRLPIRGVERHIGLMVDAVLNTQHLELSSEQAGRIDSPQTPYLGAIFRDKNELLQMLRPEKLFTPKECDTLFPPDTETA